MSNVLSILSNLIGGILLGIAVMEIGNSLFFQKRVSKIYDFKRILIILCYSIFIVSTYFLIDNMLKLIAIYFVLVFIYYFYFRKPVTKCMIVALFTYICILLGEIFSGILLQIITFLLNSDYEALKITLIANLLVSVSSILICKKIGGSLISLIEGSSNVERKHIVLTVGIILFLVSTLLYKLTIYTVFSIDLVMNIILIVGFLGVALVIIKQKTDTGRLTKKYRQLTTYSKTNERLLEEYRMMVHENKNQLVIIKSMILPTNQELINYIEVLEQKRGNIKFQWINALKYIPVVGLKGFINYKIMEMESQKINVDLQVDPIIEKTKLKYLQTKELDLLYSIMGVYLDNAQEASAESKHKIVNITVYKEGTKVIFEIANTYKGKIIENRIDEYGYSSKGKNRGTGLHLVHEILSNTTLYKGRRTITKEFYIQYLEIECSNIKKRTKTKT